jgi:hypothetical protein
VLPSPERIRLRARFVSETGKQLAQLDDLTLADLNQATLEPAVTELGGNALALGALDVVLQANPHETPQKSALELRLAALFELKRPSAAAGGEVQLIYERHPHWADQDWGLVETLEMARQLRVTVGHARPLNPDDMAMPGNPPVVASNAGELAVRASSAITMMAAVAGDLEALGKSRDSTAMRFALFAADQLGIPGAAPLTVADVEGDDDTAAAEQERRLRDLQRQVASTLAELARRQQALTAIPGGDSGAVLEAVFGEGFVVLPSLTPTEAALATFDQARRPTGADSAAALSWLAGVAPVRESVASFEAVLAYADALAAVDEDAPTMGLHIAQSGSRGERWVALPPVAGSNIPAGRVSLIAGTPTGNPPNGSLAGLLIDEWVEVVPNADETTSVAFHYDAPGATAPNVLLLGTPPQGIETWTAASAHAIVAEALDLAKIRLVDTDDLHGLGQLVPAFLTTENPAGDGISLDVEALTEAP